MSDHKPWLQWEKHLFKQERLVALNAVNDTLRLLDVLIKRGSSKNRGPRLVRIGSLLTLREEPAPNRWKEFVEDCGEELDMLQKLRKGSKNTDIFSAGYNPVSRFEITSKGESKTLAALFSLFTCGFDHSHRVVGVVQNIRFEKVNEDLVTDLVAGAADDDRWIPDREKIELQQPSKGKDGTVELWIVTEIKYANKITISCSSNVEATTSLDVAIVAGMAGGIPTIGSSQTSGQLTVSRNADGACLFSGTKFPFRFKAVRVCYDEDGKLIKFLSDMGNVILGKRAGASMKQLNPDDDPLYHMSSLFVHRSEGENSIQSVEEPDAFETLELELHLA